MLNEIHNEALPLAERKRLLIAQGASYRLGITLGRTAVRTSLSPESLAKSAVAHVAMGAMNAFRGGSMLKGGNLQVLLPLAMRLIPALSKKKQWIKPIARGVAALSVVAAIARLVMRKKRAGAK